MRLAPLRGASVTRKRIRAYATIMAATLWTVWAIDFSVPGVLDRLGKIKGTDFLQFYVSGSFVREGRSNQLYDLQAQLAGAQAVAPASQQAAINAWQSWQKTLKS